MSCSICLLPFVAASQSMYPRPPPKGILTSQQDNYLRKAYGLGHRVMGTISKFDYLDNNMFGSKEGQFIAWEGETGTFFMMHTTCAHILRHVFDAEDSEDTDGLIRLCEIEEVLGRPQDGINASRLRSIPYEDVGSTVDKVDLRPFWSLGDGPGLNVFAWKPFSESPIRWALAKPDIFPRFFPQVKPERLSSLGKPAPQCGILTQQPLDVLLLLLPHLSVNSFLALTSTCRLIRLHALTTFQPHARSLVLSLGWATPLVAVGEHAAAMAKNTAAAESLVHPVNSPPKGDWLLYLSHVNRTASMRARRRIYNICEVIRCVVEEQLPSSKYGKNIDVERAKIESGITMMKQARENMRAFGEIDASKPGRNISPPPNWSANWSAIPRGNFPFSMNTGVPSA